MSLNSFTHFSFQFSFFGKNQVTFHWEYFFHVSYQKWFFFSFFGTSTLLVLVLLLWLHFDLFHNFILWTWFRWEFVFLLLSSTNLNHLSRFCFVYFFFGDNVRTERKCFNVSENHGNFGRQASGKKELIILGFCVRWWRWWSEPHRGWCGAPETQNQNTIDEIFIAATFNSFHSLTLSRNFQFFFLVYTLFRLRNCIIYLFIFRPECVLFLSFLHSSHTCSASLIRYDRPQQISVSMRVSVWMRKMHDTCVRTCLRMYKLNLVRHRSPN